MTDDMIAVLYHTFGASLAEDALRLLAALQIEPSAGAAFAAAKLMKQYLEQYAMWPAGPVQ